MSSFFWIFLVSLSLSLSTYVITHIIHDIYIYEWLWMNISHSHSLGKEVAIRVKQLCSRWCVSPRNGWPILYFGWCPAHSDIGEWNSLLWAKMKNLMTVLTMDLWALLGQPNSHNCCYPFQRTVKTLGLNRVCFSSTLGFHHEKRGFFHQRPWDDFSVARGLLSSNSLRFLDGRPAPVTGCDKWLRDIWPWATLRSCDLVQAWLVGGKWLSRACQMFFKPF